MTSRELARKVADAVLYEGYMLYPYRHSALKNQERWSFGILYPPAYEEVQGGTERSIMHSECLLETAEETGAPKMQLELRFLQPGPREAVTERFMNFGIELSQDSELVPFSFLASDCQQVDGSICIRQQKIGNGLMKVTSEVRNESAFPGPKTCDRDLALEYSMLSAHTILEIQNGRFISLLDPPKHLSDVVSRCKNIGNFPVLVGNEGERSLMLCSPIVLYDYPQIAPESAGDFYDATEMDEMLTLRVMTLTDEEKSEMRAADARVRQMLERTEQTAREQLIKTHGSFRDLKPGRAKSA